MNEIIATVTTVLGEAWVKAVDGTIRVLKAGDNLYIGDVITTADGAEVTLELANNEVFQLAANQILQITADMSPSQLVTIDERLVSDDSIENILTLLDGEGDLLEQLDAAAAGVNAGPPGTGSSFVRLTRIAESVDPQSYTFDPFSSPIELTTEFDDDFINYPPVFVDESGSPVSSYSFSYEENLAVGVVIGTVYATDQNGDVITFDILSGNEEGYFAINPVTGEITLTEAGADAYVNDFETLENLHNLIITASDGVNITEITVALNELNVNDNPPVAVDDSIILDEDTSVVINVLENDYDLDGDEISVISITQPANGTAVLNEDGTVTYTPNQDYNGTDSFTYTISDGVFTSTATVNLVINPVNDAPVIINPEDAYGLVVEAGHEDDGTVIGGVPVATGLVDAFDVDAGAVLSWSVEGANSTTYGNFSLDATTGEWTYTLDNDLAATQALTEGQSVTQEYLVRVTDEFGAYTEQTVTITINGTNDVPEITSELSAAQGTVTEAGHEDDGTPLAGSPATGGQLTASDVDAGAVLSWSVEGANSTTYGNFSLDATTGEWTYTLDNDLTATQALTEGQSVTQEYLVRVTDEFGAYTEQTVTITINGTNDVPVITNDISETVGTVTEAGHEDDGTPLAGSPATGGQLTASDVDAGAVLSWSVEGANSTTYGNFNLDATTGEWTYTLDNDLAATQALTEGQSVTQEYLVRVTDEFGAYTEQTVTITINGTNDVPVVTNDARTVTEDQDITAEGKLSVDGAITITDVDAGESSFDVATLAFASSTAGSQLGQVVLNTDGSYTYTVDNAAVQYLNAGESIVEVYTVKSLDGTATSTITITINGTNDVPVAVADTNSVKEDTILTVTGDVLANDTDTDASAVLSVAEVNGNAANVGVVVNGNYGTVIIDANGSYTYTLNNAHPDVQALLESATLTDQFTYTLTDEFGATSSTTLTITINGTNDAPVAVADTGAVQEDGLLQAGSGDGNRTSIVEGNVLTNDTDVDSGDTKTVVSVGEGSASDVALSDDVAYITTQYGELELYSDGTYVYQLNNGNGAVQSIAAGETRTDTFTYTMQDSAGVTSTTTLTITIHGTNDAPVISVGTDDSAAAGLTETDAGLTANGTLSLSDLDTTDIVSVAVLNQVVIGGTYSGSLPTESELIAMFSATGGLDGTQQNSSIGWTFNSGSQAFDFLPQGETLVLTYSIQATDDSGTSSANSNIQTVTITITGTNDAPVAVADTGAVQEDGSLFSGTGDGNRTSIVEGNVLTNDTDVDSGDTKTVVSVGEGSASDVALSDDVAYITTQYGELEIYSDGTYVYQLNNGNGAVQSIAAGETRTDTFTYTMQDSTGVTSTTTLTITIHGTNDRPVISVGTGDSDAAGLTETDAGLTTGGTLSLYDVDTTDKVTSLTVLNVTTGGDYSGPLPSNAQLKAMLSLSGGITETDIQTGVINWTFNSGTEAFDFLPTGETLVLTYSIRARDDSGTSTANSLPKTITITITGTDDLGVITDVTNSTLEDTTLNGNVFTEGGTEDPDHGEALNITGFSIEGMSGPFTVGTAIDVSYGGGTIGQFTLSADGSYIFIPTGNYSGPVPEITFSANSGAVDIGSKTLNLSVTPVADKAQLSHTAVETAEDVLVALNLQLPVITDNSDITPTAEGDYPERLGFIRLENVPVGAKIYNGADVILDSTSSNKVLAIIIVDESGNLNTDLHIANLESLSAGSGVTLVHLTQDEYESLQILPPYNSHINISMPLTVWSYEVDASGIPLEGIDGAKATQNVKVEVLAVTDGVDITLNTSTNPDVVVDVPGNSISVTMNEDSTINLTNVVGRVFGDTDGSERYRYEISGDDLVNGDVWILNGNAFTVTDGKLVTGIMVVNGSAATSAMNIKPPANFSGEINNLTVTIKVQDTDSDSPGHEADVESASFTLNLDIKPVAGDVTIATPNSGNEDTAIYLFKQNNGNSIFTLTDTDGSETITAVGIVKQQLLDLVADGASFNFDIDSLAGLNAGGVDYVLFDLDSYLDATVTPPAQSSHDINLTYLVQTTDTAGSDTSVINTSANKTIVVKPVSEILESGSDWNSGNDFGLSALGNEDDWISLNTTEFALFANNPDDVDGVKAEETFGLFSISAGNADPSALSGSVIQYFDGANWHEIKLFSVESVAKVPAEFLDTVQFKAAPHFSGSVVLDMKVQTQDYDDDNGTAAASWTSAAVQLSFNVAAVADEVLLQISSASGYEDIGRDADGNITGTGIPLKIKVSSADNDGSESYEVTIANIPDGAVLFYNGAEVVVTAGSVTIQNFDNNAPLHIVPAHNSNDDFTLQVTAQSFDTNGINPDISSSTPVSALLKVKVSGVADDVINVEQATADVADDAGLTQSFTKVLAESELEAGTIALNSLFTAPENINTYDTDGSESVTVVVTGLPSGFDLNNARYMGGTGENRKWTMTLEQFQESGAEAITVSSELAHFSGEINFSVSFVATENDGNSKTTGPEQISVLVTPTVEAGIRLATTSQEDTLTKVSFAVVSADSNETVEYVWLKAADISGKNFTLYVGDTATVLSESVAGVEVDGEFLKLDSSVFNNLYVQFDEHLGTASADIDIQYQVKDTTTDQNGNSYSDIKTDTATYTLSNTPVTDELTQNIEGFAGYAPENISVDNLDVTASANDSFVANLTFTSPDTDGSERITSLMISGVPEGVVVTDAIYIGHVVDTAGTEQASGVWVIKLPDDAEYYLDADGVSYNLAFDINGVPAAGSYEISITAYNQDGSAAETEDTQSFNLVIAEDFDASNADAALTLEPADIQLIVTDYDVQEDTSFTLNNVLEVTYPGSGNYDFAITLQHFDHVSISGANVESYTVNGEAVYVVSGSVSSAAEFEAILAGITVTPAANFNDNSGEELKFDATLTLYDKDASTMAYNTAKVVESVEPVTDTPVLVADISYFDADSAPTEHALEDGHYNIALSVDSVDTPYLTWYNDASGTSTVTDITLTHSGVAGTLSWPGGSVELNDSQHEAVIPWSEISNLTFTPVAHASGTVNFGYSVFAQEDGASNVEAKSGTFSINIRPVADGLDLTNLAATGDEDTLIEIKADGLSLSDGSLMLDTDGSENIQSLFISGVPDGFLVYYGATAGTAVLAQNAGANGTGNNWNIPLAANVPNLWLKAPENYSGSVELTLNSIVQDGGSISHLTESFTAQWLPVADEILLNASNTYGDEHAAIELKLNAMMEDQDGSETVTLTLSGLPEGVLFLSGSDSITASYDAGTYTLTGITAGQINELTLTPPAGMYGSYTVNVSAVTVDTLGSISDTLDPAVTGQFTLNVSPKASGVTDFTSTANNVETSISGKTVVTTGYIIPLLIDGLQLNDVAGSETLTVQISGLTNALNVDVSDIAGVSASKQPDGSWLIEIGSPADSHYNDALTALQSGGIKLVATATAGEVDSIEVAAFSTETSTNETSVLTEKTVALNLSVDTDGTLSGTGDNDVIRGTDGDDVIAGGAGDDILYGGLGADTFVWNLGDQGTTTTPATDTVMDFNPAEGDALDLRDLLQGENPDNITDYLSLNFDTDSGDTTISVSHLGDGAVTQNIVLKDIDLSTYGTTEQEIIQSLIDNGNLKIDN